MNWYKKNITKESRRGTPLMSDPATGNPYTKNKPGDQNGGGGVSYQASPGEEGVGLSPDRGIKGLSGKIGLGEDADRAEGPDLPMAHDGGDKGGSNSDTLRPNFEDSSGLFSEDSPIGSNRQKIDQVNSDNPDMEDAMLSNMPSATSKHFDELRDRRK